MNIVDTFTIQAPLERVWDYLVNIPQMSQCIPGIGDVREASPDTYSGTIRVNVGPISSSFQGEVKIIEITPPERLVARISGNDKNSASNLGATFSFDLSPIDMGTKVSYRVEYTLRGRLATFGSAVLHGTVKKMTAEFAACLQKALLIEE